MLDGRAGSAGGRSPVKCGVSGSLTAPLTAFLSIFLAAAEGCRGGGSKGSAAP